MQNMTPRITTSSAFLKRPANASSAFLNSFASLKTKHLALQMNLVPEAKTTLPGIHLLLLFHVKCRLLIFPDVLKWFEDAFGSTSYFKNIKGSFDSCCFFFPST